MLLRNVERVIVMNIKQFCEEFYPIKEKVRQIVQDPYLLVKECDSLPYDAIQVVDGKLQKVVFLDDSQDNVVPVYDLLSYSKEDMEKESDSPFKDMYNIYMSQIDMKSISIQEIMSAVKDYEQHKADIQRKAEMCTN